LEVNDREEKVAKVDEMIEKEMELVGSTAIEDKL
jgi:magnesium-transporting ATPase (P-type)|tara:strand:- start:915 stop:1016 length:102 start_codon:yes stop_codon:yes gene_type:complete